MSLPEYITLNGTNYATAKLPEEARAQVQNIQAVDAEIGRLQMQLAIAQTARNAVVNAIKAPASEVPAVAEKKARKPRKPKAE